MLDFYRDSSPGRWEVIEGIDTMRFLDYGKKLKFVLVPTCQHQSVVHHHLIAHKNLL